MQGIGSLCYLSWVGFTHQICQWKWSKCHFFMHRPRKVAMVPLANGEHWKEVDLLGGTLESGEGVWMSTSPLADSLQADGNCLTWFLLHPVVSDSFHSWSFPSHNHHCNSTKGSFVCTHTKCKPFSWASYSEIIHQRVASIISIRTSPHPPH